MQLTVVLFSFVVWLSAVNGLPWSPSDPMQPTLYQVYKHQKQRNLAKIQLMPQRAINFVGPRQATSAEEAEYDEDAYYDDVYDDDNGSEEDDYEWR